VIDSRATEYSKFVCLEHSSHDFLIVIRITREVDHMPFCYFFFTDSQLLYRNTESLYFLF